MDAADETKKSLMDELHDASHQELFNLCLVLGSELTFGSFESKGMEDLDEYGEEMTDMLIEMLVNRLYAIRRGEHITGIE